MVSRPVELSGKRKRSTVAALAVGQWVIICPPPPEAFADETMSTERRLCSFFKLLLVFCELSALESVAILIIPAPRSTYLNCKKSRVITRLCRLQTGKKTKRVCASAASPIEFDYIHSRLRSCKHIYVLASSHQNCLLRGCKCGCKLSDSLSTESLQFLKRRNVLASPQPRVCAMELEWRSDNGADLHAAHWHI